MDCPSILPPAGNAAYLNHVADKLDLRRDIQFKSRSRGAFTTRIHELDHRLERQPLP